MIKTVFMAIGCGISPHHCASSSVDEDARITFRNSVILDLLSHLTGVFRPMSPRDLLLRPELLSSRILPCFTVVPFSSRDRGRLFILAMSLPFFCTGQNVVLC